MSQLGVNRMIQKAPPRFSAGGILAGLRGADLPLWTIAAHIPLGLVLYGFNLLALAHPLLVFLLGMYWAVNRRVRIEKVAAVVVYLAAVEVLWRMAQAPILWEFGKYASLLMMISALVVRRHWQIPKLPAIYFGFLLPSSFLTVIDFGIAGAKEKLSFNLSGPLVLFVACWFFSYVRADWKKIRHLLLVVTIPLISIAVTTLFYTVTNPDIRFTGESNFAASGGFGPNQVSSILGLGVFACITCYLLFRNDLVSTVYIILMTILFAAQSVMTFSRGGIFSALGAAFAVLIFQMHNLSQGVKRLIPIIGAAFIFLMLVFPYMNEFTGGKLQERFEERTTTKRIEIISSDMKLFLENPVFGVGLGESYFLRQRYLGYKAASHTEFSRMISEHGIFGILALMSLAVATLHNLRRQRLSFAKAFVCGVVVWSALFMLNAGMRLAAPSLLWGLAFITVVGRKPKGPGNPLRLRTSPPVRGRA